MKLALLFKNLAENAFQLFLSSSYAGALYPFTDSFTSVTPALR